MSFFLAVVIFAGSILAFIVWAEWWLRRRVLQLLRAHYPDWVTPAEVSDDLGCSRSAADIALDKLVKERRAEAWGLSDKYRAAGMVGVHPREERV